MTDEGKGDTEKWIAAKGAKFAYGYDKGGKMSTFFGVTGIPHAVLIDASGTVVWRGNPGGLTNEIVEQHLAGALPTPIWEWPDSAKKVRTALQKRQFAKAIEEARALGEEGASITGALETMVKGKVAALKAAADSADWLTVEEGGKELVKELSGLAEAEEAEALLDRLKGDKAAQAVAGAQKEIRKLMSGRIKKGDIPRIEKKLADIAGEFPNTGASRDAARALASLPK